jgi:hypothetical protein
MTWHLHWHWPTDSQANFQVNNMYYPFSLGPDASRFSVRAYSFFSPPLDAIMATLTPSFSFIRVLRPALIPFSPLSKFSRDIPTHLYLCFPFHLLNYPSSVFSSLFCTVQLIILSSSPTILLRFQTTGTTHNLYPIFQHFTPLLQNLHSLERHHNNTSSDNPSFLTSPSFNSPYHSPFLDTC